MADEEEVVDEGGTTEEAVAAEEGAVEGAEFVPEVAAKAKPDVFTALLVIAFVAFLTGIILAGNELHDYYDVAFWVFTKK